MRRETLVSFLLRAGLASVFLYAAIAAFLDPTSWEGFIPPLVKRIVPPPLFLAVHSIAEILLGLWLLSGWRTFPAAALAAAALASIILLNVGAFDIIFRDVAILFMALALAVMSRRTGGTP